mgnify:CR=1 FL=1
MDDFILEQLEEEKKKLEDAKNTCQQLEQEISDMKEQLQKERQQHEILLDRFEEISRDTANTMKENNVKVKKLRDKHKKDMKAGEKKRSDKKKKK